MTGHTPRSAGGFPFHGGYVRLASEAGWKLNGTEPDIFRFRFRYARLTMGFRGDTPNVYPLCARKRAIFQTFAAPRDYLFRYFSSPPLCDRCAWHFRDPRRLRLPVSIISRSFREARSLEKAVRGKLIVNGINAKNIDS